MIRSFDSKVLRTLKVFNVLFVQETVLWCDFKKLRSDIFDLEFNHFMEHFSINESLLLSLSNDVKWKSFVFSLRSFIPESFKSVSIINIIFGHVRSVSLFVITLNEFPKPMCVVLLECLECRIFLKIFNDSITLKLEKHRN